MIKTIIFFLGCIFFYYLFILIINLNHKRKLRELEAQFFLASIYFEDLKHHMLQILELVYEKAEEIDPQYAKDYQKIRETLIRKVNQKGDEWIQSLNKTLGYNFKFNSWEELIKEADRIIKAVNTDKNSNGARKRD